MKATITKKNRKLGAVANISLPPIRACIPNAPCTKQCYACKAYRMYPNVIWTWDKNFILATKYRSLYFNSIHAFLSVNTDTSLFRWHTSGDILDQDYLECMKAVARAFPMVRFLAFTKNHGLEYSDLPVNLTVVFSMWVGWGDTTADMPRAWYQDGNETRVPADALECPGHCASCGMCWHLRSIGRDVVFHKH